MNSKATSKQVEMVKQNIIDYHTPKPWHKSYKEGLTRDQQKNICEQVYPKLSNRNLDCQLDVDWDHNTCIPK